MAKRRAHLTRDEKLENLIMNHSMIFMGMFEEAFSSIVERMTDALSAGAAAMADAFGESASPTSKGRASVAAGEKPKNELAPEVRTQISQAFSGIREEMASQWPKSASVFRQYVSGPAFDKGIEIVERYDLGRPKLTEKLSDEILASYIFLLQSGDARAVKMFRELSEWQAGLPKPPWAE